jgi:hypothetical protein
MTLQARVTILEKDVATLRSRMDNADVEREHIKRQIADHHGETRGWAEIAVRVDGKMDAAAELMRLMHADIRQTKETLAEHGALLREHGGVLREHGGLLREHGDLLREHGDLLREHGDLLREILARLDRQRP